jgi:hypothetical protein
MAMTKLETLLRGFINNLTNGRRDQPINPEDPADPRIAQLLAAAKEGGVELTVEPTVTPTLGAADANSDFLVGGVSGHWTALFFGTGFADAAVPSVTSTSATLSKTLAAGHYDWTVILVAWDGRIGRKTLSFDIGVIT